MSQKGFRSAGDAAQPECWNWRKKKPAGEQAVLTVPWERMAGLGKSSGSVLQEASSDLGCIHDVVPFSQ